MESLQEQAQDIGAAILRLCAHEETHAWLLQRSHCSGVPVFVVQLYEHGASVAKCVPFTEPTLLGALDRAAAYLDFTNDPVLVANGWADCLADEAPTSARSRAVKAPLLLGGQGRPSLPAASVRPMSWWVLAWVVGLIVLLACLQRALGI